MQHTTGIAVHTGEAVRMSFDGVISAVEPVLDGSPPAHFIAPAFVDLQINGFAGVDYNSPAAPHEEIARSIDAQFATGVSRFFPTVITGGPEEMTGSLRNLARARESLGWKGEAMEAFHAEGPFISAEDGPRGAHPRRWARPPSFDEFQRLQDASEGHLRLLTVSPEWPESAKFIEAVAGTGVVVSIGHTKADSAQIDDAVRAGATMSTHLGNGAHATIRRHPNYIFDQLADDRLDASFIADGIHLGAAFLKTAIRAKGVERSVLVTDAVAPAGCPPGDYTLGEVEVTLHADVRVTLRDGSKLAGAALKMDQAVGNTVRLTGMSLRDAVTMATINAARAGRISGRRRGLQPGERADFVEFTWDDDAKRMTVLRTWMSGRLVYAAS